MGDIKAVQVGIDWHPGLPIFASEPFLRAVGEEYGWMAGIDGTGTTRCVLPYTIVSEMGIRMARFRVETIPVQKDLGVDEEREFLTSAMDLLESLGAHVVIPASTNAVFRTYPVGAVAAPYGSYIIDLTLSEEELWRGIEKITRKNINASRKCGVLIEDGMERLDECYALIKDTFGRSKLSFMSRDSFARYMLGLGENGRILIAHHQGRIESCGVYAFSTYAAYAVYAGNRPDQMKGAHKLTHWEALKSFKESGVRLYDLVGARIDPQMGSKQEAINSFKQRLGGKLKRGYMWKYSLRPVRSLAYTLGVRLLRGGDIVDRESFKLSKYTP